MGLQGSEPTPPPNLNVGVGGNRRNRNETCFRCPFLLLDDLLGLLSPISLTPSPVAPNSKPHPLTAPAWHGVRISDPKGGAARPWNGLRRTQS